MIPRLPVEHNRRCHGGQDDKSQHNKVAEGAIGEDVAVEGAVVLVHEDHWPDGSCGPGEVKIFFSSGGGSDHLQCNVGFIPETQIVSHSTYSITVMAEIEICTFSLHQTAVKIIL